MADLKAELRELKLLVAGRCPECDRVVKGWNAVPEGMHFMAPEIFSDLRELGVDPRDGHLRSCRSRPVIR